MSFHSVSGAALITLGLNDNLIFLIIIINETIVKRAPIVNPEMNGIMLEVLFKFVVGS
jgi:hypothetical protein